MIKVDVIKKDGLGDESIEREIQQSVGDGKLHSVVSHFEGFGGSMGLSRMLVISEHPDG